MREFVVDAGGIELAVRDHGGSGTPLLLLHGGGHNLATWDDLGPRLADEFRVVAYDAAAHGQSGRLPPDFELSHFADEIDAVAAAAGLVEPVLVGHSMGGANALRWAARGDAIRGVLTVDGAIVAAGEHHYPAESPETYRERLREAGWGWVGTEEAFDRKADAFDREQLVTSRRALGRRPDGLLEQRPTVDECVVLWQAGRRAADTVAIYDRIECPTLLLCAERWKPLYGGTVEETKELLADVAHRRPNVYVEWLDAGHSLHWELPDVVEQRVRDFARRLA
jgi:pimeloyl-ACP methyl ester carboxylesterase